MSRYSSAPRSRVGCLVRLLILVLFLAACYWLLLSPIQESKTTGQAGITATPATPRARVIVEGEISPTQQAALEKLEQRD